MRAAAEGFGSFEIGVMGSSYYLGFVAGCLLAPYAILSAGHIRAFAAMVALAAAVALAYVLATNVYAWVIFRLINGFCLAGFYLVIESWLNDRATNETRGFIMSSYVMVNFAAFTVGQMLVTLYPIESADSFMVAAMLASLAIIPVALTRSAQPAPIAIVRFRPRQLFRAAPVGLVASLVVGIANGAFWGLGPISAAGSGMDVRDVALVHERGDAGRRRGAMADRTLVGPHGSPTGPDDAAIRRGADRSSAVADGRFRRPSDGVRSFIRRDGAAVLFACRGACL